VDNSHPANQGSPDHWRLRLQDCTISDQLNLAITMDGTIVASVGAAALSVGGAVISAWFARRAASADARKAVDELAETVERFTRIARREQMRRVRSATPLPPADGDDGSPPPELRPEAANGQALTKAQLRAMLFRQRAQGGLAR